MTNSRPDTRMLCWSSDASSRWEAVRAVRTDRGLRANGYIIQATEFAGSYSLLVDAAGRTRRITVQSDSAAGERHLALTRTPGGPWVVESTAGSSPLWSLNNAVDADIDHSAFTHSLALRRLFATAGGSPEIGAAHPVTVACISMPTLAVQAAEHVYTYRGDRRWSYLGEAGAAGEVELTVDDDHVVLDITGVTRRLLR